MGAPLNWRLNSIREASIDEWNLIPAFLRLNNESNNNGSDSSSSSATEDVIFNIQEDDDREEAQKEIEDNLFSDPKPITSFDYDEAEEEYPNPKPIPYLQSPSHSHTETGDNLFNDSWWCSKDRSCNCSSPSQTLLPKEESWDFFKEPQLEPSFSFTLTTTQDITIEFTPSTNLVGAGLKNLGNTCFMNAILQCFTHMVPLVQGFRSCGHSNICDGDIDGFCVVCALHNHIERSIAASGRTVSPLDLANNLHKFSPNFRRHQQEDAHEFMQCALDKLESGFQNFKEKMSESCGELQFGDNDINLVEKVFVGRLTSRLQCCNCGHCSETYERVIDLSLEIENVDTLQEALESFTKVENIDGKLRCDSCRQLVYKEKQLMLYETPLVAALHLKRFKTHANFFEKIDKKVNFQLELDLEPYTSCNPNNNATLIYELYAVVVHTGFSSASGHYFCFVRSAAEMWYKMDDTQVTTHSQDSVLSQEAYILFYARQGTPWFASIL